MINSRLSSKIILLIVLFLAVAILGATNGAVKIPLKALFLPENKLILDMRLLRICLAVLTGAGLAVSGIALQAILRNPLAEPYLLGTSSGAGLTTIIAVIMGISRLYMPLAAFLGAIASIILVYTIAREKNRVSDKSLILAGVIISVALSALIVFLVSIFGNEAMHEMSWWLWGSLQVYDTRLVLLISIPVILGVIAIYFFAQDLNAISLGEEEALHLGIKTRTLKKVLILITALITASLTCVCGIIGFVGLIVPHAMRLVIGPNHKNLIPATCIAASIFMVLCDLLSRTILPPLEIPIGVITAMIGTPVFIILLKRGKRV